MILGVDFDNTIACYDGVYREIARKIALPAERPPTKLGVRDFLRAAGREPEWTEWQGYIYGPGMQAAAPFPGAIECVRRCRDAGIRVCVISHRTAHPFLGPRHDLHAAARAWIADHGLYGRTGLQPEDVFFELTFDAKLARVAEQQCDWFVDDLAEFLCDARFPPAVNRILFTPSGPQPAVPHRQATSWADVERLLGVDGRAS
ncbi:MAG: hypothetical protein K8T26_05165 [Lentisphaerae bacterium]|nr:hypothetical protein [Lentisphaerota bacterium]